jgi:hypothetical protein
VRDTDHVALADHGVGVERGGFHLDRHDPERFGVGDRFRGLGGGASVVHVAPVTTGWVSPVDCPSGSKVHKVVW